MKGEVEDEVEEAFRLVLLRDDELRTDEKVEVNGEVMVVLTVGLLERPCLRPDESREGPPTLVVKGARPRRAPAVGADSPQAGCLDLADMVVGGLGALEAMEF